MFKGLAKKKKSKKPKEGEEKAPGEEATPAAEGEFDPTALKKKKKKKSTKTADTDDFDAKLAEAGMNGNGTAEEGTVEEEPIEEGDLELGTGIWNHNATQPITYPQLLNRFFTLLHNHHPDLMSGGSRSYKIPPPQCLREGNKKTIFANIPDICKRMKRTDEHVTQFLFAELGTSGSVDGSRRLVIRGRFQQRQIENVLRRYIGKALTIFGFLISTASLTLSSQSSTWHARRADRTIQSSARARIGFTSSRAIPAVADAASRRSRPVSRPKSASAGGSKRKLRMNISSCHGGSHAPGFKSA